MSLRAAIVASLFLSGAAFGQPDQKPRDQRLGDRIEKEKDARASRRLETRVQNRINNRIERIGTTATEAIERERSAEKEAAATLVTSPQ